MIVCKYVSPKKMTLLFQKWPHRFKQHKNDLKKQH